MHIDDPSPDTETAEELLGCMRVIQTLREIKRPSHLPWQSARLGRCVLAADESEESPGLTGHTPHRVANNVSWSAAQFSACYSSIASSARHRPFCHVSFLLTLGDDTVRRSWLIRAHPPGGRM